MALVPCPECGKKVSTMASACPDCGFPISANGADQKHLVEAIRPDLAEDVSIGRKCIPWNGVTSVMGNIAATETETFCTPDSVVHINIRPSAIRECVYYLN